LREIEKVAAVEGINVELIAMQHALHGWLFVVERESRTFEVRLLRADCELQRVFRYLGDSD